MPQYLTGVPAEVAFCYCATYTVVSVGAVVGSNLYVAFAKKQRILAGIFAIAATLPSILASYIFMSAYVNETLVPLPTLPLLPWPYVWGAFFAASGIVASAIVAVTYGRHGR